MKYILIFFVIVTISFTNEVNNQNNPKIFDLGHFDSINEIEKHPKNDLFISIGKDEQIILWNFNKNSINFNFEFNSGELSKLEISPNGNFILVSNNQGRVFLINYNTFKLIDAFNYFNSKIVDFYFINNYQVLIVYQNKRVIIFDIFKKEKSNELMFNTEIVTSSIFGDELVIAERNGKISLIKISDFQIINSFAFHANERITALKMLDSENVIIAYENKHIDLMNLKKQNNKLSLSHDSFATAISTNDSFTAVGFFNGDIKIFSKYFQNIYADLNGHKSQVNSIAFNENQLISVSNDSNIMIWNLPTKENTNKINGTNMPLEYKAVKKFSNR